MERKKLSVYFFLFFLFTSSAFTQNTAIVRTGLLRAQLTISPGYLLETSNSSYYLHGNFEGYLSERLSLSGEGYYSLQNSDDNIFEYNHNTFFGVSWHFIKFSNDLYIGFQPGFSFAKLNPEINKLPQTGTGVSPLMSAVVGYNFYLNNFFHFFIQSRFIAGDYNFDMHRSLAELRFSAGLGFNIHALPLN